jgi:hypothetical protein
MWAAGRGSDEAARIRVLSSWMLLEELVLGLRAEDLGG